MISFPLVPRALAEWAHEVCAGHPCSYSDVEDMQDAPVAPVAQRYLVTL